MSKSDTPIIPTMHCKRCDHSWIPRKAPVYVCPNCKSPKWNVPKGTK